MVILYESMKIYQSFHNFLFAPQNSCMRTTELVSRADKEITAEGLKYILSISFAKNHLDIRETVRSIVDAVDI